MAENLKSIVLKRSENSSFGFSLLGIPGHGHGHVIYDIIENSSAAESGEVEAGDVIVKVNGTDVHRFTTKEVLKCLRLSGDPVTLELKRDPKIKAHVRKFLASSSNPHSDINYSNPSSPTSGRPHSPAASIYNTNSGISNIGRPGGHRVSSSDPQCRPSRIPTIANKNQQSWSAPQSPHGVNKVRQSQIPTANGTNLQQQPQQPPSQQQQQQQPNRARFEAYMMTGDLILNLSRTPQSSGLITPHAKKVDSLRDSPIRNNKRKNGALTAPHAKYDSSPSSPSLSSDDNNSVESAHSIKKSIKDNSTNINNSDNLNLHNINNNNNNNNINNSNNNNMNSDIVMNDKNSRLSGGCVNFSSSSSSSNSSSKASTTSSSPNSSTSNNTFSSHSLTTNNDKSQQNQLHQHQEEHQLQQHAESSSKQMNNGDSGKYVAGGSVVNAADEQPPQHQQQPSGNNSRDMVDCLKICEDNELYLADDNGGDDGNDAAGVIADDGDSKIINSKSRSSSSSTTVKSEINNSSPEISYSVPTSPISLTTPILESAALGKRKELPNSVPASPESAGTQEFIRRSNSNNNHHQQLMQQNNSSNNGGGGGSSIGSGSIVRKCDASGFRTSRSEDHLQQTQRDGIGAIVPIDIDEDVNSSLNTLLDTRHDSEDSQSSDQDRIVWTYNAPVIPSSGAITSPISHSSSISSSPQRSDSPASPTSVSSSVMSSSGSKGASNGNGMMGANGGMSGGQNLMCPLNGGGGGDQSVSEAISNISSPDYQDEHDLLSSKDLASMALSDPSDSDSTILVSEARKSSSKSSEHQQQQLQRDHKIVIQVKGVENLSQNQGYSELRNSEDELATITEDLPATVLGLDSVRESSPPVSDDGSDVDSLHSFHYSPKAVDIPSAVRLAKRLYSLDGFKKSDVSRHLSKNNDFSRVVADEYLKYFLFERLSLDEALRLFLKQFSLSGETQERERVLVHFSKRYLDCNPGSFNSQDAVHTLTCAIMLLNTDLHGQNIGRKMTCSEFIDNLSELNDGENFPKDVLKQLYQAIKSHHLEWALDDESPVDTQKSINKNENSLQGPPVGPNPFLEIPQNIAAIEYKKGYVMRKCCYESNFKKTPFGKRSWKMFYCTLRDLVLYLHKDEHGFRKNQMSDNVHNAIRIHHALATKASDYNKKQHVFRLQTSDQSEYLFQTSDSKELQSWIDTINFVCASFSAPPLEGGVGSQKRFQRPLLPCSHTKLLYREQLASHEEQVTKLEATLTEHKRGTLPTKGQALQNYRDKEAYLQYELKRYKTYVYLLSSRMAGTDNFNELQNSFGGYEEENMDDTNIMLKNRQQKLPSLNLSNTTYNSAGANPIIQQQPTSHHHHHHQTTSNRYSYRAAIYRTEAQQDLG